MKELTIEEKAKRYDEAIDKIKYVMEHGVSPTLNKEDLQDIFPELKESEDERIRKDIISALKWANHKGVYDKHIAWLEKQGRHSIYNVPSREVILAIWDLGNEWKELTNGSISTEYSAQLDYIQKHWRESEYYLREKQGEQKHKDRYIFKSIPRLLDMIEPTDKAKSYCQKLIDSLLQEGYATDAKIVSDCLKQMNGEKVAMAVMDIEKQGEQPKEATYTHEVEIPFGAKDSELQEVTYYIPKGFHAEIEDDKVVIKKGDNPAWSEEDEKIYQSIMDDTVQENQLDDKQILWLKFLKDRVQPVQEWNGGDAAHLHSIITHLQDFIESHPNTTGADIQGENVAWLKSLKPQGRWKPTEEQLKAFEHFVRSVGESGYTSPYANSTRLLYSLLEQLKKL